MTISIRLKIIIITTLLLSLTIAVTTTCITRLFQKSYSKALVLQASATAHGLRLQLDRITRFGISIDEIFGFEAQCREAVQEHEFVTYALVTDYKGKILFHNNPAMTGKTITLPDIASIEPDQREVVELSPIAGTGMNTISIPIGLFEQVDAWIQVGYPGGYLHEKIRPFLIQAGIISLIAIITASLMSYFIIGRSIILPLSRLMKAIDNIDNYGTEAAQLIPVYNRDELGRLTQSFNKMIRTVQRTNREILGYATRLEEKVEDRTLDLLKEIEERKKAESTISASLKEKEVLLKEIHHRVKNNLQVISSLLSLQSTSMNDAFSHTVFQESMNRVKAMALIHEKLYQSKDISSINFRDYTNALVFELFSTYRISAGRIRADIDIENIGLNIDIAIPCGLIINELVSNAFKYAFPAGTGELQIRFKKTGHRHVLVISDNGNGLPVGFSLENSESLGLRLVKGLAEEQLEGAISISHDTGTTFRIEFPLEKN